MTQVPNITLANGVSMPAIGLGVYRSSADETVHAVSAALDAGYRLFDTAAAYGNEAQVGEALGRKHIAAADVFVTTKLWISDYGFDSALHGFERSMRKLKLETLDLYLLHQPMPNEWERTIASWKALARLTAEGRVRAIGVSNFSTVLLQRLIDQTGVVPHVNQVELHPFFAQAELRATHARLGIATQAWSPIGGVTRYWGDKPDPSRNPLTHETVTALATKYGKSPAQILLRWHMEHGICAIPKSVTPSRIAENIDVFDFSLEAGEIAAIDALDSGVRSGPDPETFDTTTIKRTIED
ncbi:Morphine 6-dehydrogenase [Alphaproteobacteria bacterium SO-S41]|nr:Morphine 6-dehydrogenase [Alphaproteobacteria bacterium SO-S41]